MQRTNLLLSVLLFFTLFSAACSKTEEVLQPEEQTVRYLTGAGNRYWKIKAMWIDNIPQTLTAAQLDYWKVYTISFANPDAKGGSFTDLSGFRGSWSIKSASQVFETVENLPGGPVSYILEVNKLGTYEMDVEYLSNGSRVRTTYYAN